ncbi:MAG: 1-aminocyclopropane-carboxylate deaminase [Chloroflexi bacterium]|jgi:D-cysteine desulfhydrase|nr:1-aminocyclopropane-carboxylate deaminase [Chloroflexota bacterium]
MSRVADRAALTAPRLRLGTTPTPLEPAPRLSRAAGVEIWLKRDDLSGLGLGGNKVRALEYLLADATARGADCLVTGAGPQSNWAMLAALAARRCGLDAFLVLYGDPSPRTGNLLLDHLAGADVRFTGDPDRASVDAGIYALAAELAAAGRRPYPLPRGGATGLGALGYVRASLELLGQLEDVGVGAASLWLPTGSCGTQAGLVAGTRWLCPGYEVVGVTVSRPVEECVDRISRLAAEATARLGLGGAPTRDGEDVRVLGGFAGPGYGRPSAQGEAAARLVARSEGVLLDPVFGAKAMAALLDAAASGRAAGPLVFLVTGGAPTLFAGEASL